VDLFKFPDAWNPLLPFYERGLPINLAWEKTTKDKVKYEILEQGWVDDPWEWPEYVYDRDKWIVGDGLATDKFGFHLSRRHAILWTMLHGDVIANVHRDRPAFPWGHEAIELEETEKWVAGYFVTEPEWWVCYDNYWLNNVVADPWSDGKCTQIYKGPINVGINIIIPTRNSPASAGYYDSPSHIEVKVAVLDIESITPITGLRNTDFAFKIGGKTAAANLIDKTFTDIEQDAVRYGTVSDLGLDLIFVIDTTGSMGDDIANVKASASTIVNEIEASIPDYQVAVVDYRDFPVDPYGGDGDYPFNDVLPFSTDKAAIISAIQGLTLGWGGDFEESVYSALMHSIDAGSLGGWRGEDQAMKVIILMGDAPPHDPEPFTEYILTSVTIAAELADPVHIYTIQIGGPVEKFAELASQTGGEVFTAENAEEVVDAILEAIEEITKRPIADAGGPYKGYIDFPITFDGTGSYDPDGTIVSYEWDLDDDGEFDDAVGATPSYTWDSEYTGNISLKVTDNDGKEDIDMSTVIVTEFHACSDKRLTSQLLTHFI
jgi:hypothetical protein